MAVALASTDDQKQQTDAVKGRARKLVGWQGFTLRVPDAWDLTGFSGSDTEGYFRVDDSAEQCVEIKWATLNKRARTAPDVEVRRESYFHGLKQTARKKKIALETRETDAPRGVTRSERIVAGFTWTGDRKAIGVVWHCRTCRRTVIAQVLGARSGKGGLSGVAQEVLGSVACHGHDPNWRTWAFYDLVTEVPAVYKLAGQQLMNVYLRLDFADKTARLSIEQWSLAAMARRDAYLDVWLANNSRGQIKDARYAAGEGEVNEHATLDLRGGLALGLPLMAAVREGVRFQRPATRFSARAWECEPGNKIYAVQAMRPRRVPDVVNEVAARTRCHNGSGPVVPGGAASSIRVAEAADAEAAVQL